MKKALSILLAVIVVIAGLVPAFIIRFKAREPVSLSAAGIGSETDPIYLTAHRGGNTEAPENSLPSFRSAAEKGFWAAECDIIRTKDGRWVITHDDSVRKHFFGTGKVTEMTFDEVRQLRYSFDTEFIKYRDEKIPSLEEYLDVFKDSPTRPEIEIKSKGTEGLEDVVSEIARRGLTEKAIIISFHYESLERIREFNDKIEMWYLVSKITAEEVEKAKAIGCSALSVNYKNTTKEDVALALDNRMGIAVWTIDKPETVKTFYDMGVRYFVSNRLGN